MSAGLIAVVTLIYLGVAVNEALHGNGPMALVFFSYAMANVGLVLMA